DTLYPPPVFTFRLFRLGDNYSDTGGEAEVLNYCEPAWCVADVLSGWIKVTHSSEFNNVQVTCFSHYQRFYNEAIGSREQ
ncbi:hypothetical protein, partial [Aeromonas sp. QDB11]|uniref:hypothetical protein n=1 Tax=Aeromonas sp. QDB11 TaxID=2990482 RepID=UPI0022E73880